MTFKVCMTEVSFLVTLRDLESLLFGILLRSVLVKGLR